MRHHRPAARNLIATALGSLFGVAAVLVVAHTPALAARVPDGFTDQLLVSGLDTPVGMAFLPDGRLLVVEQNTGRIRLISNGVLGPSDPLLTVPDVRPAGERGLLGIAVDPAWPARPFLYVHSTQTIGKIWISRFTVTGDLDFTNDGVIAINASSRYNLITDIPDDEPNHNGGTLRFGPDGMLYASLGEDATPCAAQDLTTLRGVILRLDVSRLPTGSGGPPARSLITPPDNPLVAASNLNTRLVWAWGLRNPFRFHIDAPTGVLYIADVGEGEFEEIDRAPAGGLNFGWAILEGDSPTSYSCSSTTPLTPPIQVYDHSRSGAEAVISGGVYRGAGSLAFPAAYQGNYFFSDYFIGGLVRLTGSGNSWSVAPPVPGQPSSGFWADGLDQVSDYLVGPDDGGLYYCRQAIGGSARSGQIRRIVPGTTPPDTTPGLRVEFAPPFPSPATGYTNLVYDLGQSASVELVLYDIRGRITRHLVELGTQAAGTHAEIWNGEDDDGRLVEPGIYFARLTVNGTTFDRRVPFIR